MSSKVALILGAGTNVGESVASTLKSNGYAVAFGSRSPNKEEVKAKGYLPVSVDVSNPESIDAAFATVNAELGAPNVVIFNAASHHPPSNPTDPLSVDSSAFSSSVSLAAGVFNAAQKALPGFRSEGHKDSPKTFIVTGNILPFVAPTNAAFVGLGTQKVIEARLVDTFSRAYEKEGIRFYFATLVSDEGGIPPYPVFQKSGPVHAQVYWELVKQKEQGNWDHRFTIDGKKYGHY